MKLPPAPWYVDPDYRPGMEWNNHILSADSNTVCFMAHNPDDNELLENAAHLIAAAPAMFDAVNAARVFLDSYFGPAWNESAWSDPNAENVYHKLCASLDAALLRTAEPNAAQVANEQTNTIPNQKTEG